MQKFISFTLNFCLAALLLSIFTISTLESANATPQNQVQHQIVYPNSNAQFMQIAQTQSTLSTIIDDTTDYRPKLELCTDTVEIVEGQVATFDVSYFDSQHEKIEVDFPVEVKVSQVGDFIHGTPPNEVIIPRYLSGWSFDVETIDDEVSELDGRISATIVPNERYEVITSSSCQDASHVIIQDNDNDKGIPLSPEISIYNYGPDTTFQGGIVNLKINATSGIAEELPISIAVTNSNDQETIQTETVVVILPAWTKEFVFDYQTIYRLKNFQSPLDSTSTLTFEILPGEGYTIAESPHSSAETKIVHYNFTPQLEINAITEVITEGEHATFRISMSDDYQKPAAVATDLLVNLDVQTTGLFVRDSLPQNIKLLGGKSDIEWSITTTDDRIYEADGNLTVTIKSGQGYLLNNALASTAKIKIQDNDTPIGGASILSKQLIITEGDTALFEISIPTASAHDRTIYYDVRTELFALPKGSTRKSQTFNQSVKLPAHATTTTLRYETIDDNEDNEIGLLTVYLKPDKTNPATYSVADSRTWAAVEYVDNDGNIPTVRIESEFDEVEDGAIMRFELIANPPPDANNPLNIDTIEIIDVETGETYPSQLIPELITIDQDGIGTGWVILEPLFEESTNKKIAITLKDDLLNNYKAAAEPDNSHIADVKPNNVVSLSIANNNSEIAKGDTIELVISIDKAYEDTFLIPIIISNPMNYSLWRVPKSVYFPLGVDKQTINLKVNHDNLEQTDGYITIALKGEKYRRYILDDSTNLKIKIVNNESSTNLMSEPRISVAAQVARTALENEEMFSQSSVNYTAGHSDNNSDLPVLSIEAVEEYILEGDSAEFLITQTNQSTNSLDVNVTITEVGNFLAESQIGSISLNSGQIKHSLILQTVNDDLAENDGEITVRIIPDKSYNINENSYAVVKISDKFDRDSLNDELSASHNIINSVILRNVESDLLNATRESPTLQKESDKPFNYQVLGQQSFKEILKAGKQLKNYHGPLWKGVLNRTSFSFDFYPFNDSNKPLLLWGQGINTNLSNFSFEHSNTIHGDVLTSLFGFDAILGPKTNTGISVSHTNATAFAGSNSESPPTQFNANWIGVHPFFKSQSPLSGNNFHVISSYRTGLTQINQVNQAPKKINSQTFSTSLDSKLQLYSKNSELENATNQLNLLGNGMLFYQRNSGKEPFSLQNKFVNSRVTLESKNWLRLADEATLQSTMQLGFELNLEDSKLIKTWDLGGRVDYVLSPKLNFSTKGYTLFSDANQPFDVLFEGAMNFNNNLDNHGIKLNVSAKNTQTSLENLLPHQMNQQLLISPIDHKNWNLNSRLGYGFNLDNQKGVLDSYSSFSLSNQNEHTLRLGSRLAFDSSLHFDASISHTITPDVWENTEFRFSGKLSW